MLKLNVLYLVHVVEFLVTHFAISWQFWLPLIYMGERKVKQIYHVYTSYSIQYMYILDSDVRGQQEINFFTGGSIIMDYRLIFLTRSKD